VIGSIAASLYSNRLGAAIPADLPYQAATAAKGSVGGALVAAQGLQQAGFATVAHVLGAASIGAFSHSLAGSLRVEGVVALGGAVLAVTLLPSRPVMPPAGEADRVEPDAEAELEPSLTAEA
jgi:DHA2 family multidrug resistance protein-like MFS transporter